MMTFLRPPVRFLYFILFWPRVFGRENLRKIARDAPLIFIGNHIHEFDAVPLAVYPPKNAHFLAKIELAKNKKAGWLMRSLGLIFVDRDLEDAEKSRENSAVEKAVKFLAENKFVALFPEGTCNKKFKKSNEILPFKFGAAKMARRAKCQILPCALSGNYKLFSRPKIIFGEPFYLNFDESLEENNEFLRDKILGLMQKIGVKNAKKIDGIPAKNPAKNPPILAEKFGKIDKKSRKNFAEKSENSKRDSSTAKSDKSDFSVVRSEPLREQNDNLLSRKNSKNREKNSAKNSDKIDKISRKDSKNNSRKKSKIKEENGEN